MSDGDACQPCILGLLVEQVFALQDAPRRRSAQRFVRLIDQGQQLDIGTRVEFGETPPLVDRHPDPPAGRITSDQPRHLRPAQPGHLFDVAPHQAPRLLALLRVPLPDQHLLHPAVELLAVFCLKPDFLAGRDKPANCFQTQLF